MDVWFPYLWIGRKDREKCLPYAAAATGLRVRYAEGLDESLKENINDLIAFLRRRYYFPVRCNINISNHATFRSEADGHRFYGVFYDNEDVREKKHFYPEIYVAGGIRSHTAAGIEEILLTILHELSHYYQWLFAEEEGRTDRSIEPEATKWANLVLEEFRKARRLSTPFGRLRIFVDGAAIDYLPVKIRFDHPVCQERPLAACYRISGDVEGNQTVRCVLEDPRACEGCVDSGEDFLCTTFEKENLQLTIGTVDPCDSGQPPYRVTSLPDGLEFQILAKKTHILLGVAWVTDHFEYDCRTWYAADPS